MSNLITDILNPATADIIARPADMTEPTTATNTALKAGELGTDLDASLRFAERHADSLRYCDGIGWLLWDSRRWTHDGAETEVLELTKQSARAWTQKAAQAPDEQRNARIRSAMTLEGAHHLRAAVSLAASSPWFAVKSTELDSDPFALNVLNGTLDLRSGVLRPHNRRRSHHKVGGGELRSRSSRRHPRPLSRHYRSSIARHGGISCSVLRCRSHG